MQLKKIKLIEDIERYTSAFGFLLSTIISVLHSFYVQFLLKCNSPSWNSRAVVPEPRELVRVPRGVVDSWSHPWARPSQQVQAPSVASKGAAMPKYLVA